MKTYHRFKSIDEFTVLREIGRGGYSVVKLARHKESGKKYAIKCAMRFKKDKDRTERTFQEISILRRLDHPNIVRLYGWFMDDTTIYIVLQYVSGRDLAKFFKDELPTRDDIIKIMRQLIDVIIYCHDEGVVHRDIKMENILIDHKYRVRLTDFGLCVRKKYDDDLFYDEVGTARYTAPELLEGDGYNEKIDTWGVGVVLFRLLTGEYPFDGSKRKSIFRRICKKDIDYDIYKDEYGLRNRDIHLLKRLLCKDPVYRIDLVNVLDHKFMQH